MSIKIAISVGHQQGEESREVEYPANYSTAVLLQTELSIEGFQTEMFEGTLRDKVKAINKYRPAFAVECHYNRLNYPHDEKYGSGFETCIWEGSTYGKLLARKIMESFEEYLPFNSRRIWERKDLYFLKHTNCPAILIEPLFLDNPVEKVFLEMKRGYDIIASAVMKGIISYCKERQLGQFS